MFRKSFLRVFRYINPGNITIRHHYTGAPLYLHSFKHKGYWYYGKQREATTMELFSRLIRPGETVIEIGGHIGYISMYFAMLVGDTGKVIVFEPGSNNLPYLERNLRRSGVQAEVVTKAVSDSDGFANFHMEELTGQNNSLLQDYQVFSDNQARAGIALDYQTMLVETVRLDTFVNQTKQVPDFIKIDVEGAELLVLTGAENIIHEHTPIIMVEITQQHDTVMEVLRAYDYLLFTPERQACTHSQDGNVFALHRIKHAKQIAELFTLKDGSS